MNALINPTIELASQQTAQPTDTVTEGEIAIDLDLPSRMAYDIDDLGTGRLVVQFWQASDED